MDGDKGHEAANVAVPHKESVQRVCSWHTLVPLAGSAILYDYPEPFFRLETKGYASLINLIRERELQF